MKDMRTASVFAAALMAVTTAALTTAQAADPVLEAELASVRNEFDAAYFATTQKSARKSAFETLIDHAAALSARYPASADAAAWEGIVLSTYAGEVSAMSAMKYAKAARSALQRAEAIDGQALEGGLYASLGTLYSKVPGGFVGFGDDTLAAEYFAKAMEVDATALETNFFYGEFLVDQGKYAEAVPVLEQALTSPTIADRPLMDQTRRAEASKLLASAKAH